MAASEDQSNEGTERKIAKRAGSGPSQVSSSGREAAPPRETTIRPPGSESVPTKEGDALGSGFSKASRVSISTEDIKNDEIQHQQFTAATYESSPYPPPEYLAGYEQIVPGLAAQIMTWIQEESSFRRAQEQKEDNHRRAIEKARAEHRTALENRAMDLASKALSWGNFRANVGMFLAWPLVIGIVALGGYLIHEGHDWAGTTMVLGALGTVVGAYVLGKLNRTEIEARRPDADDVDDEDSTE